MTYHLERTLHRENVVNSLQSQSQNENTEEEADTSSSKPRYVPWPQKLYAAVNKRCNIIRWNKYGTAIIVDQDRYEKEVFKQYPGLVQLETYNNLRRQFRQYGFTWSLNEDCEAEFSHPLFLKGHPELLTNVVTRRKQMYQAAGVIRGRRSSVYREAGGGDSTDQKARKKRNKKVASTDVKKPVKKRKKVSKAPSDMPEIENASETRSSQDSIVVSPHMSGGCHCPYSHMPMPGYPMWPMYPPSWGQLGRTDCPEEDGSWPRGPGSDADMRLDTYRPHASPPWMPYPAPYTGLQFPMQQLSPQHMYGYTGYPVAQPVHLPTGPQVQPLEAAEDMVADHQEDNYDAVYEVKPRDDPLAATGELEFAGVTDSVDSHTAQLQAATAMTQMAQGVTPQPLDMSPTVLSWTIPKPKTSSDHLSSTSLLPSNSQVSQVSSDGDLPQLGPGITQVNRDAGLQQLGSAISQVDSNANQQQLGPSISIHDAYLSATHENPSLATMRHTTHQNKTGVRDANDLPSQDSEDPLPPTFPQESNAHMFHGAQVSSPTPVSIEPDNMTIYDAETSAKGMVQQMNPHQMLTQPFIPPASQLPSSSSSALQQEVSPPPIFTLSQQIGSTTEDTEMPFMIIPQGGIQPSSS